MPTIAPFLTTDRLELWQPAAADFAGLHTLTLGDEMRRFLGNHRPDEADSFARMMRNAGSWALYGYGSFMVRRRGSTQIIGNCGIFRSFRGFGKGLDDVPEAGWIIHHDHWGKGLAGEAMEAALAWFDATHAAQRIVCMIEEGHAASDRLARKLGFVEYARQQQPEEKPLVLYERTKPTSPTPNASRA